MGKRLSFFNVNKKVVEEISTCIEKSLLGNETLNNVLSSFLEPSEVFAATDALKSVSKNMNLKYAFLGGHKEAEYRRLEIRKPELVASDNKYGQVLYQWYKLKISAHLPSKCVGRECMGSGSGMQSIGRHSASACGQDRFRSKRNSSHAKSRQERGKKCTTLLFCILFIFFKK